MRLDPHICAESVLLAVSGGADSLVMLHLALRTAQLKFAVVHCNFHLRGRESDEDEAFVRDFCKKNGVECIVEHFDTRKFAADKGVSIEMAARELRYRRFDELCRERGFSGVCVAHNANDNAETLMLNMLRGCGIHGLCGMGEVSDNPYGSTKVYRPLLRYSRAEIEQYAGENGLEYRTDSTNSDSAYKRNLIRNEVFPLLERLNPSFVKTFGNNAAHFRQAAGLLDDYCELRCTEYVALRDDSGLKIKLPALTAKPHWQYELYELMSAYGFNSTTVADVTDAIESCNGVFSGKRFYAKNYVAVTTCDALVICPLESKMPQVEVMQMSWDASQSARCPRGVTIVDADKLPADPEFRIWREGDWMCPLGMGGKRKKVSDILTDLKYNAVEKESAVVLQGNQPSRVLAVVGERTDVSVAVDASTRRVLRITIK